MIALVGRTNRVAIRLSKLFSTRVHPSAVVETGAKIGDGCVINAMSFVGAQCDIGHGTVLHHGSSVLGNTQLGRECQVHPYAVIGGKPQDKKHADSSPSFLRIGDECVFREHCTVNGGSSSGLTVIEDRVLMLASSHVGHDSHIESDVVLSNGVLIAGHVRVGTRCVLGGGSAIRQFVNIGKMSMIGGLSAVDGHVLPFTLVQGNRSKLRGINIVGLRRARVPNSTISDLQRAIVELQTRDCSIEQTVAKLMQTERNELVREMLKFAVNESSGYRSWSWQEKKLGMILEKYT